MDKKTDKVLVDRSRQMRKNPTEEENKLWHILLKHIKPRFTRQRIFGNYIVDFFCPKLNLVVEVDGEQHYLEENKAYEEKRTAFLENSGYKIIRFYNSDINHHIKDVERTILCVCKERAKELDKDIDIEFL